VREFAAVVTAAVVGVGSFASSSYFSFYFMLLFLLLQTSTY
jgi:hypothetical protein